jgi:cysteine synthase
LISRNLPPPVTSILDLIGNTPILELTRLRPDGAARIFAKLEVFNPGGSVKDRIGIGMIRKAERAGKLRKGMTIVEPTAGNTGIGLALAGVQLGYRVILVVPDGFSVEKQELMRALGGEVVLTPKADGMKHAIVVAQKIAEEDGNAYVAQQFQTPMNAEAHYETTGPEIWEQTRGEIDAWVAGSGTGGTFTGVARFLREKKPEMLNVIVEPEGSVLGGGESGPHEVEGIGASFIPGSLDLSLANEVMMVHDAPAFAMTARLAREEGVLGGSSAGANVHAAIEIAKRLGSGKTVVTVIPDSSERYLSKGIYSNWREDTPDCVCP